MSTTALDIATDVAEALGRGRPVVALESTIFTHGLPRPSNVEVALAAEQQCRDAGVTPATIAVLDGRPTIGLSAAQIDTLAADDAAVKLSVRDLPVAAAKRLSGGTTVASTAYLASRAGVRIFATGGLGGVHQGAAATFDESADLPLLARTPILVVAAGVKSILDIPASLERMETLSITVVGYGTTDFPGFYLSDSGHDVDYPVDVAEAAALIAARDELGIPGAIVVANPVPAAQQLAPDEHTAVLAAAQHAATTADISGHDATPFMLDYIQRATAGRSLQVNIAAYRNNIALATRIATTYAAAHEAVGAHG